MIHSAGVMVNAIGYKLSVTYIAEQKKNINVKIVTQYLISQI